MKRFLSLVSVLATLTLIGVACGPLDVPATPEPTATVALPSETPSPMTPTETITPEPTATVAPTETPVPTETTVPTETPMPEVWEIWFRGFSCGPVQGCNPGPSTEFHFYSIMSDGTGLHQLAITEFPPMLALPGNAPAFLKVWAFAPPPPLISPDGTTAIYIGDTRAFYNVNMANGQATILYMPTQDRVGPYCWDSDGQAIKFLALTNSSSTMFSVKPNGEDLHDVLAFQDIGLGPFDLGVCSPDYQEMALATVFSGDIAKVGMFIINTNSGEGRKILNDFSIWAMQVAPKP